MRLGRVAVLVGLAGCGGAGGADAPASAADPGPAACTAYELRADDGSCEAVGFRPCPDGFTPDDAAGCVEQLDACGPTELPKLGGACAAVGVTACPKGFVRDATALGCAPAAAAACTGATREDAAGCVPIGDCGAPFPPAAATIFVDDDYAGPALDATHVKTIGEAIAAAPAGATIAVEAGAYAEALTFARPVTLVGRCAAQVTLTGTAAAAAGLRVPGVGGVVVRGVRVTGFEPGVDVDGGGTLDLEDSLVDENRRNGAQVLGAKSRLTVTRSAIRGSLPDASARFGVGASAGDGAELVLDTTGVADDREMGVFVSGAGTRATITRARVARVQPRSAGGPAVGVAVQSGATVEISESAVEGAAAAGVNVVAATATVRASAISAVTAPSSGSAAGVLATSKATVTLEGVTVSGVEGPGVDVQGATATIASSAVVGGAGGSGVESHDGAAVTASGLAVRGARGYAIAAQTKGTLGVTESLVTGTRDLGGVAYAAVAYQGGVLDARDVAILDTTGTAVVALGQGSKATLERALVSDVRVVSASPALGVAAQAEKSGELVLRSSVIRDVAALGVVVKGAKASLDGVLVHDVKGAGDALSGFGLLVFDGSTATVERSGFVANALSGVLVAGAKTSLTGHGVVVAETRIDRTNASGRGVTVQDGAALDLSGAALLANGQAALGVFTPSTTARLSRSILEASRATADGGYGHGAFSVAGRMDLDGVVVRDNPGVGLVFADAVGAVRRSTVSGNAVGIHVQGQSTLRTGGDDDQPGPDEVLVSDDTAFVGNASRVGDGVVPLPSPLVVSK